MDCRDKPGHDKEKSLAIKTKTPLGVPAGLLAPSCDGAQTAIFKPLVARNATFLLAFIWIGSPVAGLRPMRAARLRTCRMPRPAIFTRSPFFTGLGIRPPRASSI